MGRVRTITEIDFDTGGQKITLDTQLDVISGRLLSIKNPWTGNKRKIIADLFKTFEAASPGYSTLLDLFSGSGVVSITASLLNKNVVSNDLLTFASLNAKAFMHNETPLDKDEQRIILANDGDSKPGFVTLNYGPSSEIKRFTESEALRLDRINSNIMNLYRLPYSCAEGKHRTAMAVVSILHYVMTKCFLGGRLNKGQVLANLDHRLNEHKRGSEMLFNRIDWIRPFVIDKPKSYTFYNTDAVALVETTKPEAEICYIDPPYGGQQSDYSEMYAFFEEYVCGTNDLPHLKHCADFSSAKGYHASFCRMIDALSYVPVLVLSYNDSSWCKIDDIRATLAKFRGKVNTQEVRYPYKYRDRSKQSESKEFIIVAEK